MPVSDMVLLFFILQDKNVVGVGDDTMWKWQTNFGENSLSSQRAMQNIVQKKLLF